MATSKPKIQGYVERSLFDQFETERHHWGLTQSQALERVLAERYGQTVKAKEVLDLPLFNLVQSLKERIDMLENLVPTDLPKQLEWITSEITSSSPEITSDTLEITSNSPEITNDTPEITSSSPEITNDTPEITSSSPEITSTDLPKQLEWITSEITSSSPEITNDTPEITSSSPEITSDTPEITNGSLQFTSDSYKLFVICLFNTLPPADPEDFRYWSGNTKSQFSLSLDRAVKYKSFKVAVKQSEKLQQKDDYKGGGWEIKINTLEFFERKKHERQAMLACG